MLRLPSIVLCALLFAAGAKAQEGTAAEPPAEPGVEVEPPDTPDPVLGEEQPAEGDAAEGQTDEESAGVEQQGVDVEGETAAPEESTVSEGEGEAEAEAAPSTKTPADEGEQVAAPEATAPLLFASTVAATLSGSALPAEASTPAELELPVGTHLIEVKTETYKPFSVHVTVREGEDNRVLVDPVLGTVVSSEGGAWAVVAQDGVPAPEEEPGAEDGCDTRVPCLKKGGLAIWPYLRLRAGFEFQQPDPDVLFIGQNDGFVLGQARIGFKGAYTDKFAWTVTFDAASLPPRRDFNRPTSPLYVEVIDAYLTYRPIEYFHLWVGQTFMPADYEGSVSRGRMVFTDRSVASGGVRAGRGFEVPGLSQGRQIGLMLGAQEANIGPVALDYRVAVSNGNGPAVFGNDNKLPSAHFRLGAGWERYVQVGVGGTYNPRTTGELPNLFNETDVQGFADFKVDAFGFDFLAQAIVQQTTFDSVFPDVTDPNRTAFGYGATSWLVLDEPFGLPMFGLRPGYRISFYDPTTSFSDDQLLEHTVGVRYDLQLYELPLALLVDATMLMEIDAAGLQPLDNNRLTALLQFDL